MLVATGVVWMTVVQDIKDSAKPLTDFLNSSPAEQQTEKEITPAPNANQFVPILMYHYIRDYTDQNDQLGIGLSVSPVKFDQQMSLLKNSGYETISLADFANGKLAQKSLIITFDDGYTDQYDEALPILERYNYKATFFIISGLVGKDHYMTNSQIATLKATGMEIGGHTITHLNLANAQYEKQVIEISASLIGRSPVFAYPSGKYNNITLDVVSGLGVKAAVTTNIGVATEKSSTYELPRIRVKERTDLLKIINEETAITKGALSSSQRSKD